MATKRELVEGAYEELGLAEYVFDLSDEELDTGLRRLDRMMTKWDARGIRLGYNTPPSADDSSLNDDAGIPDWAEEAVQTNLALRLAPTLGKVVSNDTKIAARDGYRTLLMGDYQIPQMQMPRHMPIGSGNRRNVKNQTFFAPVDRVTTTHDALLDPSGSPWPDSN